MKKLFIVTGLSLFALTGCLFTKPETPDNIASGYENNVPNNIRVDFEIGWTYKESGVIEVIGNDVYINYQREGEDGWNDSFYAHLKEDGYEYYRRSVLNNTEWASFVPVSTDKESPKPIDALNALVSVTNSAFHDIFNVRIINGAKLTGTRHINDEPTTIYLINETAYYMSDNINMFMQIEQNNTDNLEWSVKVKSYQTISAFSDAPTL